MIILVTMSTAKGIYIQIRKRTYIASDGHITNLGPTVPEAGSLDCCVVVRWAEHWVSTRPRVHPVLRLDPTGSHLGVLLVLTCFCGMCPHPSPPGTTENLPLVPRGPLLHDLGPIFSALVLAPPGL